MNGIIEIIAGIGIFLLGINQIECSLRDLGSASLTNAIERFANTPFRGVLIGLFATAILQSSSVVGLITLAFVGAGILSLRLAITIILGANLGTTATGWIVALIGFKLDLSHYYLLLIGLGAFGLTSIKMQHRGYHYCRGIFGLGLLLMGLALMKNSISIIEHYFDVSRFSDYPPIFFFIAGFIFTAIIQSSSVTMMITLTAIHAGLIDLPAAASLVIGADLGTTSTLLLGSIQGQTIKRQVAMAHFIFNLTINCLAMLMLPSLLLLITEFYGIEDPLYGLVALHSSFNLLGLLLFLPFVSIFQRFIEWLIPLKKTPLEGLAINQVPLSVTSIALEAAEKDTAQLLLRIININSARLLTSKLLQAPFVEAHTEQPDDMIIAYQTIKSIEGRLADYLLDLQRQPLSREAVLRTQQLLACLRDGIYAAKALKDVDKDITEFIQQNIQAVLLPTKDVFAASLALYEHGIKTLIRESLFSVETATERERAVRLAHDHFSQTIYQQLDNREISGEEASTAFNMNREFLISGHSLSNALQNFWLTFPEVQTLSDIINNKRI